MMKKLLNYILLSILFSTFVHGLWAQGGEIKEQIEAAKVGLITQQLNLTAEQSKQFWVVYNKYTEEIERLKKQQRELQRGFNNKSDDQLRRDLDKVLEIREKEIALERKYQQEFLKVINVRQLASLYRAEKMFKAMLLQRIAKREGKGRGNLERIDDIDD
ncbi:MAG: hypothetical protein OHK0057_35990 [Thermoflexibacter sp.]